MSIVRMKRLKVIALEEQRDALLSRLQRLGCVEISEPSDRLIDPDWTALLSRSNSSLGEVKADTAAVASALAALKKYAPVKTGLFRLRGTISEAELFSEERERDALNRHRRSTNVSMTSHSPTHRRAASRPFGTV